MQAQKSTSDTCLSSEPPVTPHDSLTVKICNEMLQGVTSYGVQTLARCLTLLNFSKDNEMLGKDLHILGQALKVVSC